MLGFRTRLHTSTPSYSQATPTWILSGNRGEYTEEYDVTRITDSNASITWQTTTKRSGVGSWEFTGGNTSTTNIETAGATDPSSFTTGWQGAAFYFTAWHTAAVDIWIFVWNIQGTSGSGSADKPLLSVNNSGVLKLKGSNVFTGVSIATLSLNKWYYILMHTQTSNGSDGNYQEGYLYDGDTGMYITSNRAQWDVGDSGAATPVIKWGQGSGGDSTGLHYFIEDMTAFGGVSANPGPCRIYTRRPSSVSAAGNFSAAPGGDAVTNVVEVPRDNDTSYITVNNATASQIEYTLTASSIIADSQVHAVVTTAAERHTGSTPQYQIGVKQSSSTALTSVSSSASTSYPLRQAVHANDPATSARWTIGGADSFLGVLRDNDSLAREIRFTNCSWDVVGVDIP